ncbi:MAG: citramalate synthase [Spirochaetaceae bacterium]|jgi:2-isopropylmalate synthase|nr:citramalate synthase [Spirochaetaceae bacterium]
MRRVTDERIDIEILDTTLRDGAQGEGISFSVQDKLAAVRALDELGISWIEAGNPGSNPKDMEFFRLAGSLSLKRARLCAFGSTRKKGITPGEDPFLKTLLDASTEGAVIFGKSWDLHVTEVLGVSLEENLAMIAETVAFLKDRGRLVIYDAEHYFDGWTANPEYALKTLEAAFEAGADRIVLCDTNGGNFPDTIAEGVKAALPFGWVGIHAHNDADMASACSIAAVRAGCRHLQGTLLGFGERCGNAALASIIPSLELKLNLRCLPPGNLERLTEASRKVAEIANVLASDNMPYIGAHAFSHKAGMHADGILKMRHSFEHIDPRLVGNDRHFLMSEIGGRAAIAERARKIDPSITKDHPVTEALATQLKTLEAEGWQFEGADGSFELLVRRELGKYKPLFKIDAYRVVSEHPGGDGISCCYAWAKVWVDGQQEIAAAEGQGPVNALDRALRKALNPFFYNFDLDKVRLSDYKVRVIDGKDATAAKVRVLIESTDGVHTWSTIGVSEDIIDASRAALVDSIEYKLISVIERRFKGLF